MRDYFVCVFFFLCWKNIRWLLWKDTFEILLMNCCWSIWIEFYWAIRQVIYLNFSPLPLTFNWKNCGLFSNTHKPITISLQLTLVCMRVCVCVCFIQRYKASVHCPSNSDTFSSTDYQVHADFLPSETRFNFLFFSFFLYNGQFSSEYNQWASSWYFSWIFTLQYPLTN